MNRVFAKLQTIAQHRACANQERLALRTRGNRKIKELLFLLAQLRMNAFKRLRLLLDGLLKCQAQGVFVMQLHAFLHRCRRHPAGLQHRLDLFSPARGKV